MHAREPLTNNYTSGSWCSAVYAYTYTKIWIQKLILLSSVKKRLSSLRVQEPVPIKDMQTLPYLRNGKKKEVERCAMCWNAWKIDFLIFCDLYFLSYQWFCSQFSSVFNRPKKDEQCSIGFLYSWFFFVLDFFYAISQKKVLNWFAISDVSTNSWPSTTIF